MSLLDSIRRLWRRDDADEQSNVRERIRKSEESAIETLAARKENEAAELERRAKAEGNVELLALAKKTREEARLIRSSNGEHGDLLKALGVG